MAHQVPTPDYSVVIPFYNEEENAGFLLTEVREVAEKMGGAWEILAVNDGSTDGTARVLAEVASNWPSCRILEWKPNRGQAAALFDGMKASLAPVIITMDGDGQNMPADIPRLLERLVAADMVAGVRANRQDSWLRRKISRLANAVRSRFLGDGVSDTGCALKAFRREVVEAFIPIRTLYSFMPALAVAAGFRVVELPVTHRPRTKGTSSYGLGVFLWRPLVDMLGVSWFMRRRFKLTRR